MDCDNMGFPSSYQGNTEWLISYVAMQMQWMMSAFVQHKAGSN